jgi:hypothetical protein
MTDEAMDQFTREHLRAVLSDFGVSSARRAVGTDPSEEVLLLEPGDHRRIDPTEVATAIMGVLPHVKVWIIEVHPAWESEPL